jgi:hypothetical protein
MIAKRERQKRVGTCNMNLKESHLRSEGFKSKKPWFVMELRVL